ncbi:MAG TPA: STAS domain-containing protein [Phycisphaerales bacterium]|nr:STAS domain-containing protein [Phycisphaerales bacterium]
MGDSTRLTAVWDETSGKRVMVVALLQEKITDFDIPALEAEFRSLLPTCGHRVAVDMGRVELLGSSGLAFLIWLKRQCAGAQGKAVFFGFSDEIMGMLKLTKLNTMLEIVAGKEEAVGAV